MTKSKMQISLKMLNPLDELCFVNVTDEEFDAEELQYLGLPKSLLKKFKLNHKPLNGVSQESPSQPLMIKNGNVFPPCITEFKFTDIFDLKMTSNYIAYSRSKMPEYVRKLKNCLVFDMTGNIGCDAANFAYTFEKNDVNSSVFVCEFEKMKADCLKFNLRTFKNVYVFAGDSMVLLQAIKNKDVEVIKNMLISDNTDFDYEINELLKLKVVVNIDPPFGKDYDKTKATCPLEFNDEPVIKCLAKNRCSRFTTYIIKSPHNWDMYQKYTFKRVTVYTLKSSYYYNIITPSELLKVSKLL